MKFFDTALTLIVAIHSTKLCYVLLTTGTLDTFQAWLLIIGLLIVGHDLSKRIYL